jgi:hypothetical protein
MSDDNVTEQLTALMATDEGKAYIETQKEGLINKNSQLLGKLSDVNKTLDQYKGLGEVDVIKTKLTAIEQQQQEVLDADSEAKQKHLETQLATANTNFTTLQSTLVQGKIETELVKAIANAKGDEAILLPLLTQKLQGVYTDGSVSIDVMEAGQVAHVDGERMTIAQLVDITKSAHPNLFIVGAQGMGTKPGQTPPSGNASYEFGSEGFNLTKAAERTQKNGSYESVTKKYGWRG